MKDDIFDFGFSAVDYDPNEGERLAKQAEDLAVEKTTYEEAFTKLMADVERLLDNLETNPEKDYIYWPNRGDKISAFRDRILGYHPCSDEAD